MRTKRYNAWKLFRVLFASLYFGAILLLFTNFLYPYSELTTSIIIFPQLVPSLVKFVLVSSVAAGGFMIVIAISFLFGRVYCSFACPLGILQDVFSRLSRKIGIGRQKYKFRKGIPFLRYGILTAVILSILLGNIFLLNILDPYSNFGRIATGLFRPILVFGNNILAWILGKLSLYWMNPVEYHTNAVAVFFPLFIFLTILYLSARHGRLFCNTICPVGTALGIVSKISIFKLQIADSLCTNCGRCATECKSECIDIKQKIIDHSRCVGCLNCIDSCTNNGITYATALQAEKKEFKQDFSRREFSVNILAGVALAFTSCSTGRSKVGEVNEESKVVSPPGSKSFSHFTNNCTACQLCVNACPSGVLQPSTFEYGLGGIMQPRLDFSKHFCNYECNVCSSVCPTGAIEKLTVEEKKQTQMGKVYFKRDKCIVKSEETACGACSEHCPTQAVKMVPYKEDLTIPQINQEICIGCGACQHICPVEPHTAIYVLGNTIHQKAKLPEIGNDASVEELEEFPF